MENFHYPLFPQGNSETEQIAGFLSNLNNFFHDFYLAPFNFQEYINGEIPAFRDLFSNAWEELNSILDDCAYQVHYKDFNFRTIGFSGNNLQLKATAINYTCGQLRELISETLPDFQQSDNLNSYLVWLTKTAVFKLSKTVKKILEWFKKLLKLLNSILSSLSAAFPQIEAIKELKDMTESVWEFTSEEV